MTPLILLLTLGLLTEVARLEIIEPGPNSGIVLRERPGLLITNCRLHTQKVFVRLDPKEVCKKNIPIKDPHLSWAGARWTGEALQHAEADTSHMLQQLKKFTVTQSELSGQNPRSKRFIGGLLTAAAAIGSILGLGTSAVNAVTLATVKRHVGELQAEIPDIQLQLLQQKTQLQTIGQTVRGTVVVLNTHSVALNKTMQTVNSLLSVLRVDQVQTQLVNMLLSDMLREISSSIDSLALGRIPAYLVPLSLVHDILSAATREMVTDLQAHLAYTLGSAVPLYVNPQDRELAFIVNLPIISAENIYRLKDVVNVGFWQGDTHIKIQTPPMVAYHDNDPGLYLAPNLRMCTLTKEIHYLCPSKPFIRDSTNSICGLKPMVNDARCATTATPRHQVESTQAELVGSRWLVSTPAREALLTYDQHDTADRMTLPSQTFWASVPTDAILHVEDLALYHLQPDQYASELEIPDFFAKHTFELEETTLTRIQIEGTQALEVTPIDNVLKEIAVETRTPGQSLIHSWSTSDTALVAMVSLGYVLTGVITYIYFKRTQRLQTELSNCSERMVKLVRQKNRGRDHPVSSTTEDEVNEAPVLIELQE